jgi:dTDP-4-amino-4,6-dideoxy-D-galactose acyltransferase
MDKIQQDIECRSEKLFYYSPYHFIREIDPSTQFNELINKVILKYPQNKHDKIIEIDANNHTHNFFLTYLPWDTNYFQIPVYKIFTVLYQHHNYSSLSEAVSLFRNSFLTNGSKYCFIELPVEDSLLLQAFTGAGFRLIETRITYYKSEVQAYAHNRFPVRSALPDDIYNLKQVAYQTRNPFDRLHADPFFEETADRYLATYTEKAIEGFADKVLVPDEKNVPPNAFVAINYLNKDSQALNCQLSRIMLSAVSPLCRGWHYKLVSEAIYQVQSIGANYLLLTTQAANRAVIRNCEKLGFKFGACSHILSYYVQ